MVGILGRWMGWRVDGLRRCGAGRAGVVGCGLGERGCGMGMWEVGGGRWEVGRGGKRGGGGGWSEKIWNRLECGGEWVDLPLNSSIQYWEVGEVMKLDNRR